MDEGYDAEKIYAKKQYDSEKWAPVQPSFGYYIKQCSWYKYWYFINIQQLPSK
jgi:hypothetical protein